MSGIIQAIIEIDEREDIDSLMDTRGSSSGIPPASRRNAHRRMGIRSIRNAHEAFKAVRKRGMRRSRKDHLFHLAIARACGNQRDASLIGI
jgi:DNA-binding FadR family transcriptional regulator